MRIKRFIDEDFQVYAPSQIYSPGLGRRPFPILFLVDTGATVTTILEGDAERINVNFRTLRLSDTRAIGIGGLRETYELDDVTIAFEEEGTGELIFESLNKVDVLKPEEGCIKLPFSLLGTDLLQRLEFRYRMPLLEI